MIQSLMRKIITTIDLGSNKIAVAMAGVDKKGDVFIIGLESMISRGITGGDITDINRAVEDISSVTARLKRRSKKKIKNVFVTTKGTDIKMDTSRGMVALSRSPRIILKKDVKKCLDLAAMVKLPLERVVIDKIVKGFHIDGSATVVGDPVGLYGIKLESEAFIATANRSKVQNIAKCIDHAGFLMGGVYLSGIASADSVLDGEEKQKGVLLLDIGDSLTEVIVFKNGTLKGFSVIKKGASDITGEERCPDKIKLNALLKKIAAGIPEGGEGLSSAVVTGGGALLDGVIEEAEKAFGMPTRIGIVKKPGCSLNPRDAIIHTATIGLIEHIARDRKADREHKNPARRALHKIIDLYESYF